MSPVEVLILAVGLSLDAVVVAVGAGALNRITHTRALYIAGVFALFQGMMPLIGWAGGLAFQSPLAAYGNLIGFTLLMLVGLKMLKEALGPESESEERTILRTKTLIALAVATSIDALVAGITFTFIPVSLSFAVLAIGLVTFVGCLGGIYVGRHIKHLIGTKLEVVGALVIMLLAVKVLLV